MKNRIALKLSIKVIYKPNGTPEKTLKDLLEAIVTDALGRGGFTGETSAEVETTGYEVITSKPSKKYPKEDWVAEVQAGDTSLGYEDWVGHQREAE